MLFLFLFVTLYFYLCVFCNHIDPWKDYNLFTDGILKRDKGEVKGDIKSTDHFTVDR